MIGFKNTTKTQYSMGGAAYAKGGSVKGAAKVAKVMGEFKSGKLHSGSKSGPAVTNPKQAVAISLSEARKAGAKMPMKKKLGGAITDPAGAVARGNRMQAEEAGEDKMVGRKSSMEPKADTSKFKNYSDPTPDGKASALSARLSKRGPAGAGYKDQPMLSRAVDAIMGAKGALGLKKGGLAAMPKTKC